MKIRERVDLEVKGADDDTHKQKSLIEGENASPEEEKMNDSLELYFRQMAQIPLLTMPVDRMCYAMLL